MNEAKKTALVTGGSRGIGRAVALELARAGMNVAIIYAGNTAAATETVSLLEAEGVTAKSYQCDVADEKQAKQTVDQVLTDFGGVDVLVNNAGITRDALLLSAKEADTDRVLAVSLKGAFHMIQALYRHFMKKRAGRIINLSSVVGLHGNAGQASYAAAKAGVIGLTKSVAKELASRGVTRYAWRPSYRMQCHCAGIHCIRYDGRHAAKGTGRPSGDDPNGQARAAGRCGACGRLFGQRCSGLYHRRRSSR